MDGGLDAQGRPIRTSRVVWGGKSKHSADSLLAENVPDTDLSSFEEAKEFLKEMLFNGPITAKKALREAKESGISERTLKRAKSALQVASTQRAEGWVWSIPKPEKGQDAN